MSLGVVVVLTLGALILVVLRIGYWLMLPHRCPSCDSRFDEAKVPLFCTIAGKEVRFCHRCVNYPIGRLGVNNLAFAAKGFTAEDLCHLHSAVDLYKYRH